MAGFKDWFYSIPPFTRTYVVILLLTGFGGSYGLFDPFKLVFIRELILKRFELWRLISNFLYIGGPSMSFVFNLMFIMTFGSSFEKNPLSCTKGAAGDAADFLFCLLWGVFLIIITAFIVPSYVLSMPLIHYCIYLWSKQNPSTPRSIWGISIQGFYIPFALMALNLLMGAPITENIIGILTGHLFYYCSQINEKTKVSRFFTTPAVLRQALSLPSTGANKKEDAYARYTKWGKGHKLSD